MTNATAPPAHGPTTSGITIRVYTVNPEGLITEDTGTRTVRPERDADQPAPLRMGTHYPPCECQRHRPGAAQ